MPIMQNLVKQPIEQLLVPMLELKDCGGRILPFGKEEVEKYISRPCQEEVRLNLPTKDNFRGLHDSSFRHLGGWN